MRRRPDRSYPSVAVGKSQAIRNAFNEAVSPIANFSVIAAVVDNGLHIEIDPARQRHTMLREIDRFLGWIEVNHLLYIQFDCAAVKRARGIAPVKPHPLFESFIQAERAAAAWQRFS